MSTVFIDFAELKQTVKIEDVAAWVCPKLVRRGASLRSACPVHGGDDRSFAVTPGHIRKDGTVGSFYCHASQEGGDLINLVQHIHGLNKSEMPEAARRIAEQFGFKSSSPKPAAKPPKTVQEPRSSSFDPEAYAARLDANNAALEALGVSPETYQTFKAGFAATGVHRGKLALPLHDRDGKLIGHFARSLKNESPLLTFVNGQNPAEHIFAAHLVTEGDLYIAHDPLAVLVAYENGETNVVAFLTDGISPQQWEMLASLMDQRKVERSFLFR